MHAIRLHAFGPAENLSYDSVPDPVPGAGQVRIAVAAAGVHLIDTALRRGESGPYPVPDLPTIPGREVAGTVDRVGADVDPAWLGKAVVAHLGMVPGGYAELAVTEVGTLHDIPANLDPAAAVAIIGTGRTTMGILQFTELGPDDIAIVTAAAGGIGTLLVQYAKNAGAMVVGLAGGPAKTELVRNNGAGIAIDYREPGWPDQVRERLGGRSATVLFDSVGGATTAAGLDLLGPGAHHLIYGWSSGEPPQVSDAEADRRGIRSETVVGPPMLERIGGDIRALEKQAMAEAASGRWKPAVSRYPLAEAAAAHHALENRGTTGKVVLEP
ncbi:zinc-binding dehydrogenase [Nocardia cyriacigeorgica]|uniref:Zinc-binding dehydrogenase n=1 Tax=Nocardia cyriacigeorgica TaxID=135487 RepID=A0A6P1D7F2_9NOCA|nr:zinc-binding dehydrogenase [Nocardia cyriacigeorgica]NEW45264.1 zinc-binding dehydrogenase [Nocardia cyriacigeorgica]NEW51403.1 zinc-binding dehydrogenase [Nocardia cyriacigeorgica]NEW55361.1 zinc-binding dehydrogenase [Nocardia cyriacigeorgica]